MSCNRSDGVTSEMPMDRPRCAPKYRPQNLAHRSMLAAAASEPQSRSSVYSSPDLLPSPIDFLAMFPLMSSELRKATHPSFGQKCWLPV
jgi:hypothetical protein